MSKVLESRGVLLPFFPSEGHSSILFYFLKTQIKRGAGLSLYKLLQYSRPLFGPRLRPEVALGDAEVTHGGGKGRVSKLLSNPGGCCSSCIYYANRTSRSAPTRAPAPSWVQAGWAKVNILC